MGSQASNLERTEHKIISDLKDEYYEQIVDKYSSLLDNYMLAYKECRKHLAENNSSDQRSVDQRTDNERLSVERSLCQDRLLDQCKKLSKYYEHKVSKLPVNILKMNGIDHPPFCLDLSKDMENVILHTHNLDQNLHLDIRQNNNTIHVNKDDLLVLSLHENPTTGYAWELKTSSGLNITETSFSPSDNSGELIGSGGIRKWSIRAISKGQQMISGVYKRPWENATEDNFNFNLKVNVT